jgi:vacuolar-type H+-ATPase subunit I/STV1
MFRKGRVRKVLTITILLVLALSTIAIAANEVYVKQLTATFGKIKFKVDGKDVTKEIESKYDTPAFTVNSRSYVPVRAIAELMGMEVKWDGKTHTAEIIDVKSKAYEEELKKKDKEIDELKKEIEKLKKNVVEEKDLKTIQKELNSEFGTYEDVDFDITLKESKNRIDATITMDLRNSKQESAWLRMSYSDRKAMIEDIADIILSEFTNVDIYGSIYDEYYRRDVITFNKKKGSSLIFSYSNTGSDYYDEYIDEIVYDEFYRHGIKDAYISKIGSDKKTIYFDIDFPEDYRYEWRELSVREIENMMDMISDEIIREYYYDDYYYYEDRDVDARIYMDGKYQGEYFRGYDQKYGTFEY